MEANEILAHLDLARAYLDMGLIADAVDEWELLRRTCPDDERVLALAEAIRNHATPLR